VNALTPAEHSSGIANAALNRVWPCRSAAPCRGSASTRFRTYSCCVRGLDMMNGAYRDLGLTPKGRRDEAGLAHTMAWLRLDDEYGAQG
jgi:predicted dithiol-disulfide oxidoreductase (DUF899 family)